MPKAWNIKTIFRVFLGTFAVLFFVGILSGLADRQEMLRPVALQHLTMRDIQNSTYLAFECNGKVSHAYDVENNSLSRNPMQLANLSLIPVIFSLRAHKELILSALGGSSGAVTVSTLRKSERRPTMTAAVAFGFISGYLAGYWVATLFDISCASSSVAALIDPPEAWKDLERDFMLAHLYSLGVREPRWFSMNSQVRHQQEKEFIDFSLSPMILCNHQLSSQVASLIRRLQQGKDVNRVDFRFVADYAAMLSRLQFDLPYQELRSCTKALYYWTGIDTAEKLAAIKDDDSVKDIISGSLREHRLDCMASDVPEKLLEEAHKKEIRTPEEGATFFDIHHSRLWFDNLPEYQEVCKRILRRILVQVP